MGLLPYLFTFNDPPKFCYFHKQAKNIKGISRIFGSVYEKLQILQALNMQNAKNRNDNEAGFMKNFAYAGNFTKNLSFIYVSVLKRANVRKLKKKSQTPRRHTVEKVIGFV